MTVAELREILDDKNRKITLKEYREILYQLRWDTVNEQVKYIEDDDIRYSWYNGEMNGFRIAFDLSEHIEEENNVLNEFEKDARWESKYQHKTRTEELNLPTWDEAEKGIEYNIYSPKGCIYRLKTKIKSGYSCDKENPYIIRIEKVGYANSQLDFEFNEENYTKACDYCLKLFNGEENER